MNSVISRRLTDLGFELPQASPPTYAYSATAQTGNLLFVSGQIPKRDGEVVCKGRVGENLTLEEGRAAAEIATLGLLAQVEASVGLDRVARVVKLNGYVASAPDFFDQPKVIDGASKLLRSLFGSPQGDHARTALPAPQLPRNASVELEAILEILPATVS